MQEIILPAIENYLEKMDIKQLEYPQNEEAVPLAIQGVTESIYEVGQSKVISLQERRNNKYTLIPNMEKDFKECRGLLSTLIKVVTTNYDLNKESHKKLVAKCNEFLSDYSD